LDSLLAIQSAVQFSHNKSAPATRRSQANTVIIFLKKVANFPLNSNHKKDSLQSVTGFQGVRTAKKKKKTRLKFNIILGSKTLLPKQISENYKFTDWLTWKPE